MRGPGADTGLQPGRYALQLMMSRYDLAQPSFIEWLAAGGRRPDDETLERWEKFVKRMDAGILHRGKVPGVRANL
jgi:hypothetical protein